MSFYERRILPYLVHVSMRQETFDAYRRRAVSGAHGSALEIGVGSGLNLPLYGNDVRHIIGIDPSPKLLSMARVASERAVSPVELLEGSAEKLPLEDNSIDSVVTTWTLCTIPDVLAALEEIRRVLKPSGCLLFVEHGRAPDASVRRWQDRLTPFWKRVAGGCHLNRDIGKLIEESGFRIEEVQTGYMSGPKAMTFMCEGRARSA